MDVDARDARLRPGGGVRRARCSSSPSSPRAPPTSSSRSSPSPTAPTPGFTFVGSTASGHGEVAGRDRAARADPAHREVLRRRGRRRARDRRHSPARPPTRTSREVTIPLHRHRQPGAGAAHRAAGQRRAGADGRPSTARGSSDPDGDTPLTYKWTLRSQAAVEHHHHRRARPGARPPCGSTPLLPGRLRGAARRHRRAGREELPARARPGGRRARAEAARRDVLGQRRHRPRPARAAHHHGHHRARAGRLLLPEPHPRLGRSRGPTTTPRSRATRSPATAPRSSAT